MIKFVLLLSSALFFAELAASNPEDHSPTRIRELIAELGDDEFVVRERAETQLLRIGVDAFAELKQATKSDDVEISLRARRILSQFEQVQRGKENESVRDLVDLFTQESNIARKTQFLWIFADPTEYPDNEGLRTLCRIARFDEERILRVEAVKCLIASSPISPSKRKIWYRTLQTVFADRGDDELLRLAFDYAELYNVIDDLREEAEKNADAQEKESGIPVEYPVRFATPEDVKNRVRAFTDRLAAFQSKPENSEVQPGHRFDILLFHALAELQDAADLTAECDRTLEAALAVRTEKMRSANPLLPIDPLDESSFSEHFYAAIVLEQHHRFLWAQRHLQLVVAEAPLLMKLRAYEALWFIKQLFAQYQEGVEIHERCLEIVKSDEYKAKRSDAAEKKKNIEALKDFCLAKLAVEAGDWRKAKESIDRSLRNDPVDCDAVILRFDVTKNLKDVDENYRRETRQSINGVLNRIERDFMQQNKNVASLCNQTAWLLANTEGDFPTALSLIRVTIKTEPESPMYLDTMGHVYVLGKDYEKAVEAQRSAVRLAPEATSLRLALERFRTLAKEEKRTSR